MRRSERQLLARLTVAGIAGGNVLYGHMKLGAAPCCSDSKIALDIPIICDTLNSVDYCVWECGSLFTLSGAEGLPLFLFPGSHFGFAIPKQPNRIL